jgi:hypothetical protein
MKLVGLVLVVAAGCGRHGFDPIGGIPGSTDPDATRDGDGALLTDAAPDSTFDVSPSCINDLSNVGTANFEISFDLQVTATTKSALVHQRAPCTAATYWDIYINDVNRAVFEIQAGGSMATSPSLVTVANGAQHKIVCNRIGAAISISVDGASPNTQSGSTYNLTALPPIEIATAHPCAGFSPLSTGTVTNVCIRLL